MYRSLCQFTTLMLGESSVSQRPIKNYGVGLIAPPSSRSRLKVTHPERQGICQGTTVGPISQIVF